VAKINKLLPIVKISGVEVLANFRWTYTLGANPYITTIIQKSPIAEEIYKKARQKGKLFEREGENFKFPIIDIDAQYTINFQKFKRKITNILLLNHSVDRLEDTTLTIADSRWLFAAIMVRANYNMTWQKPEFQIAKGIQQSEDFNGIEKIDFLNEFRDRYRLNKFAYIKETIKADGTPWSALELLESFMKEYAKDFWGGYCRIENGVPVPVETPDWSDVTTNNLSLIGSPLTDVIDQLLSDSRSNCTVFDDGKLYVFPLIDSDKMIEVLDGAGVNYDECTISENKITKVDNQHRRSTQYLCGADCEQEMIFYYHFKGEGKGTTGVKEDSGQVDENKSGGRQKGADGIDTSNIEKLNKSLGERTDKTHTDYERNYTPGGSLMTTHKYFYTGNLINVASLTYPITIKGIYYEVGSYINMLDLLSYYNIPVKYLLHAFFEGRWRGLIAAKYLNKIKADGRIVTWKNPQLLEQLDPDFRSLIAAIENDWWQTFRVDPEVRQHMLSFSASRAAVAQYLSGARIHTPVWVNYMDMTATKRLIENKDAELVAEMNANYKDKSLNEIVNSNPTPFRAFISGDEIIHFDTSTDRRGFHYKLSMGSFLEKPKQMLANGTENNTNWLKADWLKLAIILNVKWVLPNTGQNRKDGIYQIRQTGLLGGTAPTKQIFMNNASAKFAWRKGMKSLEEIISNPPINIEELKAYAASYTNVLEFQNRDWYVGVQEVIGCFDKVYSFGNCEVSMNFSPDAVTTRFNATPPRTPSVKQAMPYNLRRLYFGEAVEKE